MDSRKKIHNFSTLLKGEPSQVISSLLNLMNPEITATELNRLLASPSNQVKVSVIPIKLDGKKKFESKDPKTLTSTIKPSYPESSAAIAPKPASTGSIQPESSAPVGPTGTELSASAGAPSFPASTLHTALESSAKTGPLLPEASSSIGTTPELASSEPVTPEASSSIGTMTPVLASTEPFAQEGTSSTSSHSCGSTSSLELKASETPPSETKIHPETELNWELKLAESYLEKKTYEQALTYFDYAIKNNPYLVRAYKGRAKVFEGLGKPKEAEEDLFSAKMIIQKNLFISDYIKKLGPSLKPDSPLTIEEVAEHAYKSFSFEEDCLYENALIQAEVAWTHIPNDYVSKQRYVEAILKLDKKSLFKKAFELLNEIISKHGLQNHFLLTRCYFKYRLGMHEQAIVDLTLLLLNDVKVKPLNSNELTKLVKLIIHLDDPIQPVSDQSKTSLEQMAKKSFAAGKYKEAINYYTHILHEELNVGTGISHTIFYERAKCYERLSELIKVRRDLTASIWAYFSINKKKVAPQALGYYIELTNVCIALGKLEDAISIHNGFLQLTRTLSSIDPKAYPSHKRAKINKDYVEKLSDGFLKRSLDYIERSKKVLLPSPEAKGHSSENYLDERDDLTPEELKNYAETNLHKCLKLNPTHKQARELFKELKGTDYEEKKIESQDLNLEKSFLTLTSTLPLIGCLTKTPSTWSDPKENETLKEPSIGSATQDAASLSESAPKIRTTSSSKKKTGKKKTKKQTPSIDPVAGPVPTIDLTTAERLRKQQEEKAKAEAERLRKLQEEKAKADAERLRKQQAEKAKAEAERLRKQQEEKAKAEAERLRKQQAETAKAEAERLRKQKAEKAKAEAERLRKQQEENAKAEAERLRKQQAEKAKAEAERLRKEQAEKAKAKAERLRKDQAEKAKAEAERLRKEQAEKAKAKEERQKKERDELVRLRLDALITKVENIDYQRKCVAAESEARNLVAAQLTEAILLEATNLSDQINEIKNRPVPLLDIEFTILKTLNDKGAEAYLTGGSLRDRIQKGKINFQKDIDIVTSANPKEILDLFLKHGIVESRTQPGLFQLFIQNETGENIKIEIWQSELLKKSLVADASHRDFTINALYAGVPKTSKFQPNKCVGQLNDPLGCGLKDLIEKKIDTVIDPAISFDSKKEAQGDPVRPLRAVYLETTTDCKMVPRVKKTIHSIITLLHEKKHQQRINGWLYKVLAGLQGCEHFTALLKENIFEKLFSQEVVAALHNEKIWIAEQLKKPHRDLNSVYMFFVVCAYLKLPEKNLETLFSLIKQNPLMEGLLKLDEEEFFNLFNKTKQCLLNAKKSKHHQNKISEPKLTSSLATPHCFGTKESKEEILSSSTIPTTSKASIPHSTNSTGAISSVPSTSSTGAVPSSGSTTSNDTIPSLRSTPSIPSTPLSHSTPPIGTVSSLRSTAPIPSLRSTRSTDTTTSTHSTTSAATRSPLRSAATTYATRSTLATPSATEHPFPITDPSSINPPMLSQAVFYPGYSYPSVSADTVNYSMLFVPASSTFGTPPMSSYGGSSLYQPFMESAVGYHYPYTSLNPTEGYTTFSDYFDPISTTSAPTHEYKLSEHPLRTHTYPHAGATTFHHPHSAHTPSHPSFPQTSTQATEPTRTHPSSFHSTSSSFLSPPSAFFSRPESSEHKPIPTPSRTENCDPRFFYQRKTRDRGFNQGHVSHVDRNESMVRERSAWFTTHPMKR